MPTLKSGLIEKYTIADGREAARYWVHDQIIVGGEVRNRADGEHLEKDLGITHVLSLQNEVADSGKFNVPVCQLGMPDQGQDIPDMLTNTAKNFVSDALKDPKNRVYIHCQIGGSRSPAIAYAMLLACKLVDSKAKAMEWIRECKGDWQGGWQPYPKYIESIDKAINIAPGTDTVCATEHGTLSEDGLSVWNGRGWVAHGHSMPAGEKGKWPKRLMQLRNGSWFPYTKLFVSTPTYFGQAFATYMGSLLQLARGSAEMGIEVRLSWPRGDGIARCRNRQISEFLDTDCTHYIAIDADIGFNPQHLMDMVTSGLDITFGAYPAKGIEWEQLWRLMEAGVVKEHKQMETAALRFVVNYRQEDITSNQFPTIEYPDGRLFLEVNEASTGFTCIKRSVIEDMIANYPELTYLDDYPATRFRHQYNLFKMGIDDDAPHEIATRELQSAAVACSEGKMEVGAFLAAARAYKDARSKLGVNEGLGRYLSEDYGFCRLAKRLGYKIYIYTQAHLSHTGLYTYEGSFSSQFGKNSTGATIPLPTKEVASVSKEKINGQQVAQPEPQASV